MKKRVSAFLLTLSLSLPAFYANADYNTVINTTPNKITSFNMIPTQLQFAIIDLSQLTGEDRDNAIQQLSSFSSYHGNVAKFIDYQQKYLQDIGVSVSSGGEMMSVSKLRDKQATPKDIQITVSKNGGGASYSIDSSTDYLSFNYSGHISINSNQVSSESNGALILASYKNF